MSSSPSNQTSYFHWRAQSIFWGKGNSCCTRWTWCAPVSRLVSQTSGRVERSSYSSAWRWISLVWLWWFFSTCWSWGLASGPHSSLKGSRRKVQPQEWRWPCLEIGASAGWWGSSQWRVRRTEWGSDIPLYSFSSSMECNESLIWNQGRVGVHFRELKTFFDLSWPGHLFQVKYMLNKKKYQ